MLCAPIAKEDDMGLCQRRPVKAVAWDAVEGEHA
jgi:hypothetical protein